MLICTDYVIRESSGGPIENAERDGSGDLNSSIVIVGNRYIKAKHG